MSEGSSLDALLRRLGPDAMADLEKAVEHGEVDALARIMVRGIDEVLKRAPHASGEEIESPEAKIASMRPFAEFLKKVFKSDLPTMGGKGLKSFISSVEAGDDFESFPPELVAFLGRHHRADTLYQLELARMTDLIPLQTPDVMEMWEDIRRQVAKRAGKNTEVARTPTAPTKVDPEKVRLVEENQQLRATLEALQVQLAQSQRREELYRTRTIDLGEKVYELGQKVKELEAQKKPQETMKTPVVPSRMASERPSASLSPNEYLRQWLIQHSSGHINNAAVEPLVKILRERYSKRELIESLCDQSGIPRSVIYDSGDIGIVWSKLLEKITDDQIRSLINNVLQS